MRRRASKVAAAMIAVFFTAMVPAVVLAEINGNFHADTVSLLLAFAAFMGVGALVVGRHPSNAVGWVFSAIGLLASTGVAAQEYAEYAYVTRPGSLPGAIGAAWYASWYWLPLIILTLLFTVLLFPTGRPLSPRWTPVLWVAATATASMTVLAALNPTIDLQDEDYSVPNPIGVKAVGDVEENAVGGVLSGIVLLCSVASIVSLVIRFRRSRRDERQQLKWFTYAATLVVFLAVAEELLPFTELGDWVFGVVVALLPVAAGIAILKYRLYDIDRIINKTLVYGAVTALLGLGYAGGVLLAQAVLPVSDDSPAVVAITTLAVVALFRPLRSRVQSFVDRRFYRRRYDAARTIESFGSRLRQETDLDSLSTELLGLVKDTMQPAHASLWLRKQETA